jgi:hypothetical protein
MFLTENKLIFLSIGYSTRHWCHVMEEESFSDPEVGQLINDTFIAIKVDREERPDMLIRYRKPVKRIFYVHLIISLPARALSIPAAVGPNPLNDRPANARPGNKADSSDTLPEPIVLVPPHAAGRDNVLYLPDNLPT